MIDKLRDLKDQIQFWYEDFMWKNGPERKLLAHERLKAHNLAMKEGRNSPYTHPEDYPNGFY